MYTDEDKAIFRIKGYLNVVGNPIWTDQYVLENYGIAVEAFIEKANKINLIKIPGVKSKSDGVQSVTFVDGVEAWSITDDIKTLLPLPFVRLFG